jgi:glycosyltransferase involved in cell wall biosynthesis
MRPRILVLSQHYRPEPNFIAADVAEALAQHADVMVVTAHPNYPTGRFYPGTRYWRPTKTLENGVTVWRVPFLPDHSTSKLRRMVSYLSFALAAALVAPFVAPRPTLVWVYQGPFTTMLAALWYRFVRRVPIVLTCADLWPESFTAAGVAHPGVIVSLALRYRRVMNRLATLIICSTRGTYERFAAEGIPRERLRFVPVWVDGIPAEEELLPDRAAEGSDPVVVYAGNLGPAQQLETVLHGAALLEREGAGVCFELYGAGADEERLRSLAAELGLRSVRFRGRVSPEQAFEASSRAFAQIVSLRRDPLFAMTLPSKLFGCFAAGAPVLYGLEGEAAELVARSGGGVEFDPDEPASLAGAIGRLMASSADERCAMRTRLRCYYREHFARDRLLEQYIEIVSTVAGVVTSKEFKKL